MAAVTDFPARGKVSAIKDGLVLFKPDNTNYEIHATPSGGNYDGPMGKPIEATLRVTARKVYTVPSGGNFITPLFGPPKIIQGRVRYLDNRTLVVHAGVTIVVDLPSAESAIDLDNGNITVGTMVNVVALRGATFAIREAVAVR